MPNRARGQPSLTMIDHMHPWQVELPRDYVEKEVRILVSDWMRYRTPAGQGARRQVPDRAKERFAFTTAEQAQAFQAAFGGTVHEAKRRA